MTARAAAVGLPRAGRRYLRVALRRRADADTAEVMRAVGATCSTRLERDPMECARELDWVAKLALLQGYRDRDGLDWTDHRLRRDRHPVVRRPAREGAVPPAARPRPGRASWSATRTVKRAVDDAAGGHPGLLPRDAACDKYADEIAAASWDSVIFDVPGHASLQRVPMLEPLRGTRATRRRPARPQPRRRPRCCGSWRRQRAETGCGVTRLTITKVDTLSQDPARGGTDAEPGAEPTTAS